MTQGRGRGMSYYSETEAWHYIPTFDNGATNGQLRFLEKLAEIHSDSRYVTSYHRGLALLLAGQQPNGCWPQTYPLEGGYHDAATFNDDVTVLTLSTLDDVAGGRVPFATASERTQAAAAARRGVTCLIAAQVVVNGKRTVWGQQHDPITLAVVRARTYEIVGLAGRERASIVAYLMSLPQPDARVVAAGHSAAEWFRAHSVTGYRYSGYGLSPDARPSSPICPRPSDIGTNRPIFAN